MDSDTFYGEFVVKLLWRLSSNFIYHIFSMKPSDKLHNFSILLEKTHFLHCLKNLGNFAYTLSLRNPIFL